MKKIFSLFSLCLFACNIVLAELPQILAVVNEAPITLYEFEARKRMIRVLNNIENIDDATEKKLNKAALNSLIEEQLLFQHIKQIETKISEQEVAEAIANIEQRNKMAKGQLVKFLESKSLSIDSFTAQIKAELIKLRILSEMSKSINISQKERDFAIFANNTKDAKILAKVFVSNDKSDGARKKMQSLQQRLKNNIGCSEIKPSLYQGFATLTEINEDLNKLNYRLQNIIKDLGTNQVSSVFETQENFELVLVCSREIKSLSNQESEYVVNFLSNKKLANKAQRFFEELRRRAYIKVMLPEYN